MEPEQKQEFFNRDELHNETHEGTILRESPERSMSWVWWLLGIFIILGLGWYFFSKNKQNTTIIDGLSQNSASQKPSTEIKSDIEKELAELGPLASIDESVIQVSESFPVKATLRVKGNLSNGCTYLNDTFQRREGTRYTLRLTTRQEGDMCTEALVPFDRTINLDVENVPAGTYFVDLNGETLSFEINQANGLEFDLGNEVK